MKKTRITAFNHYSDIRALFQWLGYKIDLNNKSTNYEKMIINCGKDCIFIPIQDGKHVRVGNNISNSRAISRGATEFLRILGQKKATEKVVKSLSVINKDIDQTTKRIGELQC